MANSNNNRDYDQISGIFNSHEQLSSLVDALNQRGISGDNLSILMSDRTRDNYFAPVNANKAPEGASTGGITGGILGALVGGLSLVGSIALPGAGLLVAGPIIGALTGAGIGGATGSLVGGLIGAGIPEHEAKYFEDALKEEGKILVVVRAAHEMSREVKGLFDRFGAHQVKVK